MELGKVQINLTEKAVILTLYRISSKTPEISLEIQKKGWDPLNSAKNTKSFKAPNYSLNRQSYQYENTESEQLFFTPTPQILNKFGNTYKLRFYCPKGLKVTLNSEKQPIICDNLELFCLNSPPFCHIEWGNTPTYKIIERLRIGLFTQDKNPQITFKTILFTNRHQNFQILSKKPDKIYEVKMGVFGREKLKYRLRRGYRIIERVFEVTPTGYTAPAPPWGGVSDIEKKIRQRGCQIQRYWEVTHPIIREIANSFNSAEDIFELSWAISEFVQKKITFREHLTKRLGALATLEKKYGDCDEFTDLFITLCRAVGIPARRITGLFVKSDLGVENHAWAEIYSPVIQDWIPVDVALGYFGFIGVQHLSRKIEETYSNIPDFLLTVRSRRNYRADIVQEEIKIKEIVD
ncbi:MAG: transglutaminase family protein [Promethearchaeota archaeon]